MAEEEHKQADVLIVGAGPAGLMLAVQLLRYGIRPYIMDESPDADRSAGLLMLTARTMEYFKQLGLEDELHAKAIAANEQQDLPLDNYLLVSPPSIERPLLHWLGDQACPIHWHSSITAVSNGARGILVQMDQNASRKELHIPWLVYTAPGHVAQIEAHSTHFSDHRRMYIGRATGRKLTSPGQSINTDLQDAVNLGWKLALVAGGKASPALLDSYKNERQEIPNDPLVWEGKAVLVQQRPPLGNKWLGAIRDALLKRQLRNPTKMRSFKEELSQLGITYRHSPLSHHHAHGTRIMAGDRLPDLPVFDEKTKKNTSLQQWCFKPGFVLLLLGTLNKNSLFVLSQWVLNKYPDVLQLYYLPYSPANDAVFAAFELKPDAVKMIIIRPDMHIGYVNDTISAGLVETYLQGVIGVV